MKIIISCERLNCAWSEEIHGHRDSICLIAQKRAAEHYAREHRRGDLESSEAMKPRIDK